MAGKWKKGVSGNPSGRPKNSKNKSTPHYKLQKALQNGWDMKDLKRFAKELITAEDNKLNAAQVTAILKTLFDVELKLMDMEFKNPEEDVEDKKTSSGRQQDEDDDDEDVVFKLTAD